MNLCTQLNPPRFEGALSRYFAPLMHAEICLHINGNSKIMMKFVYWRLNNCTETVNCYLLWWIAKMDCILKNKRLHFSKSLFPYLRQNKKYTTETVPWQSSFNKVIIIIIVIIMLVTIITSGSSVVVVSLEDTLQCKQNIGFTLVLIPTKYNIGIDLPQLVNDLK